jgi:hypothetical protein
MKGTLNMKRTFALTIALALASLGVSAYAQTPADPGSSQTQSGKKHKKQHTDKKEKKEKKTKATPASDKK